VTYDHLLVSGATGSIGAELLLRILRELRPARITLLIRAANDTELGTRLRALGVRLRHRGPGVDLTSLRAVAADLTRPGLGLERSTSQALCGSVDGIVHSAADTRLDQSEESAQRTNRRGTASMLEFATGCTGLRRLVHLSTAYVSGDRVGEIREDELDCGQKFLNAYERSKFDAEVDVRVRANDLPVTVLRPSIVVGDSRDGHAFSPAAILPVLRQVASGRLRQFPGGGSTRLDLVPVDYVTEAVCHVLRARAAHNGTFHVTAGPERSVTARRLFELTIDEVGRHLERPLSFGAEDGISDHPLIRRLRNDLACYLDYLCYDKAFDDSRYRRLVGDAGRECPAAETFLPVVLRAAFRRKTARAAFA
jgi:long-chain acyl-CoA synthetase